MTTVLRSDDMRRRNRLRIIEIVRRMGAISRGEIAQSTALSPATVSTISNNLIAEGVLVARGSEAGASSGRGRPSVDLSVNPGFRHAVLVILKFGAVNVAIVDYAGAVIARQNFDADMANITREDLRAALIAEIRQSWEASGLDAGQLGCISVGVQGTTDIAAEKMLRSPMTPLTDLPIADWLREEFGAPVRLANDCDLIAKALNWRDPQRYQTNFAAILLAHGVGMGLFLRGQIVNGTQSSGTEFGHMLHAPYGARCRCGARGCIEAYAGDYAIKRRFRGEDADAAPASHIGQAEIARIANAAREGDPLALETFRRRRPCVRFGAGEHLCAGRSVPHRLRRSRRDRIRPDGAGAARRAGELQCRRRQGHSDRPLCRRVAAGVRGMQHRGAFRYRRRPGRRRL